MADDIRSTIRWKPDEWALILKGLSESGLKNVSDFVRQVSLCYVKGTQVKLPPSPVQIAILGELRAQGNNLNQITRVANASGFVQPELLLGIDKVYKEIFALQLKSI
jgi:hypothetical protein